MNEPVIVTAIYLCAGYFMAASFLIFTASGDDPPKDRLERGLLIALGFLFILIWPLLVLLMIAIDFRKWLRKL